MTVLSGPPSRFRRTSRAAAALVLGALALGSAILAPATAPATAASVSMAKPDTSKDGYWYYEDYGVAEAAAAGYDGSGVKVAVIDMQLNPKVPQLSTTNLTVHNPSFCADFPDAKKTVKATTTDYSAGYHGNDMVGLIGGNGVGKGGKAAQLGVAQGADITFYSAKLYFQMNYYDCPILGDPDGDRDEGIAAAVNAAIDDGNDIIMIAMGNAGGNDNLFAAVARAVRENIVIVAARPNSHTVGTYVDIYNMNGVVTVQAMERDGKVQAASVVADRSIDVVGPGVGILGNSGSFNTFAETSGTSNAAAITAGFLAIVKSKYPDADGAQLIQSLIRNTGVDDHELSHDPQNYTGYGAVSLRHMLANDPTQYESVNPLLDPEDFDRPTKAEIYGSATAAPGAPAVDPDASGDPAPAAVISPLLLAGGGLVGLLVLGGIIALVIVLVRRSARSSVPRGTP